MNIIERMDMWFVNKPRRGEERKREAIELFDDILLPEQPECLEIGCGQGVGTSILSEKFNAQVIASDIDPKQIGLARKRLAYIEDKVMFKLADSRKMPFKGESFDLVCEFGVLHHIDPGWRQAVSEIGRVLKGGGYFVFIDWVWSQIVSTVIKKTIKDWDIIDPLLLKNTLVKNNLIIEKFECEKCWLGLMRKCNAIVRKQ